MRGGGDGSARTETVSATDRYVLEGVAAARGAELRLFDTDPVEGPTAADVERACA